MSLYEAYQPSSLYFNNVNPLFMDEGNFSPPFSSPVQHFEHFLLDQPMEFPVHVSELRGDDILSNILETDLDEFDYIFNDDDNEMLKSIPETDHESRESYHSPSGGFHEWSHDHDMSACEPSIDMSSNHAMGSFEPSVDLTDMHPSTSSLIVPFEGMEVDNHLCLVHLIMAYAEAMDNQNSDLSEVIERRIVQRVHLTGGALERVLYYMFQCLDDQLDYLTQESTKNFYQAFKAMIQIFPYGKFVHFVVNLAIQEAFPRGDVDIIHLIDFDIGEGVQLASLMDVIKHHHKEIRVTSVKFDEENETGPLRWRFEETKRRLLEHAWSCGLKIEIEEVGLRDLERFLKKWDNHGRKSWFVFNYNVGIPHMGRVRSRNNVLEFLRLAKNFLQHVSCCDPTNKGIITCGDGESWQESAGCTSFSSFLDRNIIRYQALLESMESDFPSHLGEARISLECLFVAPYVSSLGRKWEEKKQWDEFELGEGLEGWKLSEKSLVEAKELVKEGFSPYEVRIEGQKKNEMVMRWNGVEMVRVCCWKV